MRHQPSKKDDLMSTIAIQPMQWTGIADLEDTPPLSDDDFACMRDIRDVLLKHNKVSRFALHLIHKHFNLEEDEVLVEYNDAGPREQYFKVEKADSEIVKHSIPTTWTLEDMTPMARCVCAYRMGKGHLGRHETA
jgi:hypothetical protein